MKETGVLRHLSMFKSKRREAVGLHRELKHTRTRRETGEVGGTQGQRRRENNEMGELHLERLGW